MFVTIKKEDIEYNLRNLSQLVFEVTDACNLRCKYCAYADLYEGYDKRKNQTLPFNKAKLIIDYLVKIWKENRCRGAISPINIGFYGGEPLLNIRLITQIIDYLEQKVSVGKKYIYSMTTNAMLLDKYMDYLVEKKFRLLISLDGNREGQGYRVDANGKNSFDKVYQNVCLLRDLYPIYFRDMVRFNSVLHSKNSVESIYDFIEHEFDKTPSISTVSSLHVRKDKVDVFNRIYRNYAESVEESINCENLQSKMFIANPKTSLLLDYIYRYSGNVFSNYNQLFVQNEKLPLVPTGTCSPFSKKMFVSVNGKILQCEKIGHQFLLGQITDTSVELDLEQVANQHNEYVYKYINQCRHCANQSACSQCVYQIDDIQDKGTVCRNFCSEQQQESRKEQALDYLDKHPELYEKILKTVVIRG